jgi:oxygen-independent coproporphyrinogen-3 oxidase
LIASTASGGGGFRAPPPLALYVHIPWCLRKCPYCDFNSHALPEALPESRYLDALLRDLEQDAAAVDPARPLLSVFVGGGTPSLFSGTAIARLLRGIGDRVELRPDAEITLEANPGAADAGRFAAYRDAGVNRLSIGAQSLSADHLKGLGRVHGPQEVGSAVAQARQAGIGNLNLDLMYGLPGQDLEQARRDLDEALALEPEHLSYYQLTLEPNTAFHNAPPPLPEDDLVADMQVQGGEMLADAGYRQYEISAYARPGYRCRHNSNYWEFGDYLGIGAGAHAKLTDLCAQRVERCWKLRQPRGYLDAEQVEDRVGGRRTLEAGDLVLEFAMNALRLTAGFERRLFEQRTGLPFALVAPVVAGATADGLLDRQARSIRTTDLGRRFLNDLLQRFSPGLSGG